MTEIAGTPTFVDKYILDEAIVKGDYADIHYCECKATGERRVVKIMNVKSMFDSQMLVAREMKDHPGFLRVLDTFEEDERYWVVTECGLRDLFDQCDHESWDAEMTEDLARMLLQQIMSATAAMHKAGLIHCDLKPENIIVMDHDRTHPRLVLIDFDFTQEIKNVNAGTVLEGGTLPYTAPERLIDAKSVTFKSDMWSIGMTAFRLLVGKFPFRTSSETKEVAMLKSPLPLNLGALTTRTNLSHSMRDLVQRMLVKDPKQRISLDDAMNHIAMKGESDLRKQIDAAFESLDGTTTTTRESAFNYLRSDRRKLERFLLLDAGGQIEWIRNHASGEITK